MVNDPAYRARPNYTAPTPTPTVPEPNPYARRTGPPPPRPTPSPTPTFAPTDSPPSGGSGYPPGEVGIPAGYLRAEQERAHLQQRFLQAQQHQQDQLLQSKTHQQQQNMARSQHRYNSDLRSIEQESRSQENSADRALQQQLQTGQLDAQKYMQAREIVQRESEFARNLALQTRSQEFQEEMSEAQLVLDQLRSDREQLGVEREERLLQAQLAANPADFVAYEFYKRGLEEPGTRESGESGEGQQRSSSGNTGTFADAPPAYSDKAIQDVASNVFSDQQQGYNPRLSGTGAFGADIPGPQQLSRGEANNLSDSEMSILGSFLKAGVETGSDGQRTAIDPAEYFSQAEESWIPTLKQQNPSTTYR